MHGANRLASNSLLEGLVFAHRAAQDVVARVAADELPQLEPVERPGHAALVAATMRTRLQRIAAAGPGVIRSGDGLARAGAALEQVPTRAHRVAGVQAAPQTAEWETTNLHQVASVLTAAAAMRPESRGGHFREDMPAPDDAWALRIEGGLDPDGELVLGPRPIGA